MAVPAIQIDDLMKDRVVTGRQGHPGRYGEAVTAALVYAALAGWLYHPYLARCGRWGGLLPINAVVGAMGGFVLSRRWVNCWAGSALSGAIYGFGPLALYLSGCHPTAGSLAAAVPWLFWPAVWAHRGRRWAAIPLAVLPFVAVVCFFQAASHCRLFPTPLHDGMSLRQAWVGMLAPGLAVQQGGPVLGSYQIPIAAMVLGLFKGIKARSWQVLIMGCTGVGLALWGPFWQVSPLIWWVFPVLAGCVLAGLGVEGLILAGPEDRYKVLSLAILLCGLALSMTIMSRSYPSEAGILNRTAWLYGLGALGLVVLFAVIRSGHPSLGLRSAIVLAALAPDIVVSSRFILDRVL